MLYHIYNSLFPILVYKCSHRERCPAEAEMRLKSEHMPPECGETDHIVSNSFQNDVFSAHFTFQEKEKEFLRLEGDIVIFKDIPKLKIAECEMEGELRGKRGGKGRANKESSMQKVRASTLFDNC